MLDRQRRNGLLGRLVHRAGKEPDLSEGIGYQDLLVLVAPVAMVNYPRGAETRYLKPMISTREIQYATMCYVDKQRGTLDDLYMTIWHMHIADFVVRMAEMDHAAVTRATGAGDESGPLASVVRAVWGPRGAQIGTGKGGLPIYELRSMPRYMGGGGWCAARTSSAMAPLVLLEEDAVDVPWRRAAESVVDTIELCAHVFRWPAQHLDELQKAAGALRSAQPYTSRTFETGPSDETMRFFLLTTDDAARMGAVLELARKSGRQSWIERGFLPSR